MTQGQGRSGPAYADGPPPFAGAFPGGADSGQAAVADGSAAPASFGLRLEGTWLTHGGVPLFQGLGFGLDRGEFVTVIGRSGAGKTSLLNLAAGFSRPDAGRVTLDGRPVTGPGADRAVVFQDDALFPWLDVRGNVAFPLALAGADRALRHSRVAALLDEVGLAAEADRRIWELSGGQRQRVGIARALAAQPPFLLMDEPLGALDAMTRERMQEMLLRVWDHSGAGILLITHSVDEALFLGTRTVVLAPGPGRIVLDLPQDFGRRFLAGEPARHLRADPDFIAAREVLLSAIHDGGHDGAHEGAGEAP